MWLCTAKKNIETLIRLSSLTSDQKWLLFHGFLSLKIVSSTLVAVTSGAVAVRVRGAGGSPPQAWNALGGANLVAYIPLLFFVTLFPFVHSVMYISVVVHTRETHLIRSSLSLTVATSLEWGPYVAFATHGRRRYWYGPKGLGCDERSCRTSVVQALTYIQDASTGVIKGNTAYALDLHHLWRTGQGLCSLRCRVVGIGLNGTTYNNTLLESNINSYPIIISRLPLFPLYHPSSTNNRRVPPFTGI